MGLWDQLTGGDSAKDSRARAQMLNAAREKEQAELRKSMENVEAGGVALPLTKDMLTLKSGMNLGKQKAEQAYGKLSDVGAKNIAQSERMGEFSKGYSSTELGALRDQARSGAKSAQARSSIQSGAQGLRGEAGKKAGQASVNQMGEFERNLALDNASMIRSGTKDYMAVLQNSISRINQQSLAEGGLMANISAGQNIANVAPPSSGGTVICTHLFEKGYMTIDIYYKDQEFGRNLIANEPEVYCGYRLLADPIVSLMEKSYLFTKIVSIFALPWANHIAGRKNLLGALILNIGKPICRGIYGIRIKKSNCQKEA